MKHRQYVVVKTADKSKPSNSNLAFSRGEQVSDDRLSRVRNKQPYSLCNIGYTDHRLRHQVSSVSWEIWMDFTFFLLQGKNQKC